MIAALGVAWTMASMAFEAVGLHAMTAQHIELAGDVRSLSGISHTHDARCDAEFTPKPAHESALALIGGTNRCVGGRVSTAQLHECVFEAGACAPRYNGDRRVRRASFHCWQVTRPHCQYWRGQSCPTFSHRIL
jgi:hypothetical protein